MKLPFKPVYFFAACYLTAVVAFGFVTVLSNSGMNAAQAFWAYVGGAALVTLLAPVLIKFVVWAAHALYEEFGG